MDILGQTLWWLMFFTPLLTVPLSIRLLKKSKLSIQIIIGFLLAFFLSLVLYGLSLAIIFKEGMGS